MTARIFEGLPPFPDDVPTFNLPILSLKLLEAEDEVESERLFQSSKVFGCFQIDLRGTKLGDTILRQVDELYIVGEDAFDLPLEEKMNYKMPPGKLTGYKWAGYLPPDAKGISRDRWEMWSIPKDNILRTNTPLPYPTIMEQNRELLKSFCATGHDLTSLIFRHMDAQLHLPRDTLIKFHAFDGPDAQSDTVARWVKCGPQEPHDQGVSFVAHRDVGTLAILFNILGGLQLNTPGENGDWTYVKPRPGHVVINVGDTLARYTGGAFKAVLHRVYCAPGAQSALDRYSISYFLRPEDNVVCKRVVSEEIAPRLVDRSDEDEITVKEWNLRQTGNLKEEKVVVNAY